MNESRRAVRDYTKEYVKNDGWKYWKLPDPLLVWDWRRVLIRTESKTIALYCAKDCRFTVKRFDGTYKTSFFFCIRIGWFGLEIMSWIPEAVNG